MSPSDVVSLALLAWVIAHFVTKYRRPTPAPVRKGSPVYIAPAEVNSTALIKALRKDRLQ